MPATRRALPTAAAASPLLPLILIARGADAAEPDDTLPPPRYQLAMNLEIMFPGA
jgi:hypothetical protein